MDKTDEYAANDANDSQLLHNLHISRWNGWRMVRLLPLN